VGGQQAQGPLLKVLTCRFFLMNDDIIIHEIMRWIQWVCHIVALPFTLKKNLKAKEEL
jgi:hypothetical protein